MKLSATALPGCVLIAPDVIGDRRGSFYESWNRERFKAAGLDFEVAQSNVSISTRGVLRGLHFQWPHAQGKLVSVLEGEVFDVAVDIRRGSPQFGRWTSARLSAENRFHIWIPEGFAHGFQVLSERAVFSYLCTASYRAETEGAIRFDDPALGIEWPLPDPGLSARDAEAPLLSEIPAERLPRVPESTA